MAVNLTDAAKSGSMTGLRDHFADGTLEIQAADDTVLVAFGLSATGGSIATGVWTFAFDNTTEAATATGTATKAQIKTNGGVADITGLTVGTSGTDVIIDNTSITDTQNVTISAFTLSHD